MFNPNVSCAFQLAKLLFFFILAKKTAAIFPFYCIIIPKFLQSLPLCCCATISNVLERVCLQYCSASVFPVLQHAVAANNQ